MTRLIEVAAFGASYPVLVQSDALNGDLEFLLAALSPASVIMILSQPEVVHQYAGRIQETLHRHGLKAVLMSVPDGESAKKMKMAELVCQCMSEAGCDRDSTVMAVGGGCVGDLAAFCASVYMRGVEHIQVPTSLVAMVDASVGGKSALNLPAGRNLVGSFHQPARVLIDPRALETLPGRHLLAGWTEVLKYGFIMDAGFLEVCEESLGQTEGDSVAVPDETVLARCCQLKASVVAEDERDTGIRRILNFGHTFGHALEAVTGFGPILHGEAVAYGMLAATAISHKRGFLSRQTVNRICNTAGLLSSPPLPSFQPDELLAAMGNDKKWHSGRRVMVLLKEIGQAVIVEDISDEELRYGMEFMIAENSNE
jgi:3-dehydroquinate synthase